MLRRSTQIRAHHRGLRPLLFIEQQCRFFYVPLQLIRKYEGDKANGLTSLLNCCEIDCKTVYGKSLSYGPCFENLASQFNNSKKITKQIIISAFLSGMNCFVKNKAVSVNISNY